MMAAVLLLAHGFQPEYEAGYANGLARNGVRVILIGSDMTLRDRVDSSVEIINLRGSQDPRRPAWRKALNLARYWCEYMLFLLRHRRVPVHVIGTFTTGSLWVSLTEGILMRWVTSKYVLTVHNLLPHDRHTPLNAWLSRLIYRTPAICVVHTLRMKDALVSGFGVDPKKIVVVEHGIDRLLPRTEQSRQETRARLALPPQDRVILFFGGIAPYKGLDILLSAYDLLPDKKTTTLLIAGRCKDPNLEKWLRDEIKMRAAASMHILWLGGYIPDEDVPGLFHGADLLAMPYRHIDQSGVIFMALATGLPIVASDVGTLRDYIPSGFGAVVPPLDPQAFAMALSSWLDKAKDEQNIIPPSFATRLYWSRTLAPMLPIYARLTKG